MRFPWGSRNLPLEPTRLDEGEPAQLVLVVPRGIVLDTFVYFQPYWRNQVETACFWFGIDGDNLQVITTLAMPRLLQSSGHYRVEPTALRQLSAAMRAQGLVNLAQIHTHPSHWVGHSRYDDANAYSTREGALSLVWPEYGFTMNHRLDGIGIHECRGGRWVQLDDIQRRERIRVVDSQADYRWKLLHAKAADEDGS